MRVQVLQHVPFESLGTMAAWFNQEGFTVAYTRFFQNDPLPGPADADWIIVLGGPMSVNDEAQYPWLAAEKAFLCQAMEAEKRILGICLGAQLLASALGSPVYPAPEREIGWFPIFSETRDQISGISGETFKFPENPTVFHWHDETFDLPSQTRRLAHSAVCPNQAFQLGPRILGLQFHLEMTPAGVESLVRECGAELTEGRYVQTPAELLGAAPSYYEEIKRQMVSVLDYLARA
ncbi:MAG: type 1 glutamine amidotransferase [Cyanobacteriota bacterium]|jgi:GMP synthase-like glutamine amidotransferase